MAKKKAEKYEEASGEETNREKAVRYHKEWQLWRTDLQPYWLQMDKNQEMYEFYRREYIDSDVDISLNTPFSIVESLVAKLNESTLQVTVRAKGEGNMEKFEEWVASTIKDAINDTDVAEYYGSFRKTKEKLYRSFFAVGFCWAQVEYCYKTSIYNGEKKVVADNPYVSSGHFKNLVFNPTRTVGTSDVYYVEEWTDMKTLQAQEYKEVEDEDGSKSKSGKYINLTLLKKSLKDEQKASDDPETMFVSGNKKINKKNAPIHILKRWEGPKLCVVANDKVIIREEYDPLKIGGHNLLIAENYVIEGRPYPYGEIDAIYKPVRAQDTVISQSIEIVNKYLRGSYILGPSMWENIDSFLQVIEQGGAMPGDPEQVTPVPVNVPPAQAFQTIDTLQQAIERAARYSPYAAGTPNQASDNTAGTKGGILALQSASEPNFQVKLDAFQDQIMRPMARKFLKMIGALMSPDEIRYSLMKGESKDWVKATKGVLTGKATIKDMVTCGLISEEEALEFTTTMQPVMDQMTGQPVIDPATGQPAMQPVPIEGADEAYVFDVDWVVDVMMDNQSAVMKVQEVQDDLATIDFVTKLGGQFSPDRILKYVADRKDREGLVELMLTPEELQQQAQQQMQMQQEQMQQQMMAQQQEQQAKMQEGQMKGEQQQQSQDRQMQGQMQLKAMELSAPRPGV